jgi:hypothetical protein
MPQLDLIVQELAHSAIARVLRSRAPVGEAVATATAAGIRVAVLVCPHQGESEADAWTASLLAAVQQQRQVSEPTLTPLQRRIMAVCSRETPLTTKQIARLVKKPAKSSYLRAVLSKLVKAGRLHHRHGGYVSA